MEFSHVTISVSDFKRLLSRSQEQLRTNILKVATKTTDASVVKISTLEDCVLMNF
jgi:hypothetical protein